MESLRSKLVAFFFSFDTRSLALFRVALGLACSGALFSRFEIAPSTQEVPPLPSAWSPVATLWGAVLRGLPSIVGFGCAVVFALLILGYRTKLAQILSLLAVAAYGGGVLAAMCLWSVFMPLGERFSIDSVQASLRRREQQVPVELNDRVPIRTPARRFYSLACAAAIAFLIVMPLVRRDPFELGASGFALLACWLLLLQPSHWAFIARAIASLHAKRVVFVDEDCGFCMLCARLLARLDVLERLEFASNADEDRLPRSISLDQANESITTLEPGTGRVKRGAAAFAALLRSLPAGFVLAVPLELPGLRGIAEWAYMHVANRRLNISLWLGYGACGVPSAQGSVAPTIEDPSSAETFRDRSLAMARELLVAASIVLTLVFD